MSYTLKTKKLEEETRLIRRRNKFQLGVCSNFDYLLKNLLLDKYVMKF